MPLIRGTLKLFLWSMIAASAWATAQTSPQPTGPSPHAPASPYSLQVNSQLVILDVVVTDKKGAPVAGLTRDDFHVFENKVPQQIVSLEEAHSSGPARIAIHSTAELDRLEPQAPVSILVLDEVTSKVSDEAFAQYALEKYLAGEGDVLAQPTMLLAVSLQHQMLLHDYTTSKKEVLDALKQHFKGPNWHAANSNPQGQQMMATLLSLTGVAGATAGHPGHKNIVWIGRGFPSFQWQNLPLATADQFKQAIATCTNRLRDARATVYAIDPAGVAPGAPISHADPDALINPGPDVILDPFGGQEDFDAIAIATGGMALHGENDVDRLIRDSVTYGKTFYTLAYKPAALSNNPQKFRSIRIAMADPTLSATAPQGYFEGVPPAPPVNDAQGKVPTQVAHDLAAAADGLMVYDAVPLSIEPIKDKPGNFTVSFPAHSLAWVPDGAQEKGDITLLVSSYDKKGKLLHRDGHVVGFVRQPLTANQTEGRTLHVVATTNAAPPAVRLRVIVRSNGNGKIGAANYPLTDPNN